MDVHTNYCCKTDSDMDGHNVAISINALRRRLVARTQYFIVLQAVGYNVILRNCDEARHKIKYINK